MSDAPGETIEVVPIVGYCLSDRLRQTLANSPNERLGRVVVDENPELVLIDRRLDHCRLTLDASQAAVELVTSIAENNRWIGERTLCVGIGHTLLFVVSPGLRREREKRRFEERAGGRIVYYKH